MARRLRELSQLTGWLVEAKLSSYVQNDKNRTAFQKVEGYTANPRDFLTLWGGYGTGKTHLLAGLVNELTAAKVGATYFTLPDLLDYLRRGVANEKFDQAYDRLAHLPVLVIDELDKARLTDWAQEQVYRLVDLRYRERLIRGTVFATNTDPAKMPHELDYLASRLCHGDVVHVGGPDVRRGVR